MRIRNDLAKSVALNFMSDTFNSFEFSPKNVLNMIAVKMFVQNNFDKLEMVVSKDGYIDITALEEIILPDIEKLGKFEVPAIGTRYIFTKDDIKRLLQRLKENADS